MVQHAQPLTLRPTSRVGRPPIPHEHGAWVMLYLPAIVGFSVAGGATAGQWAALLAAVTGLFLAREAAGLLIRKRGKPGTGFWLCVYLAVALAGVIPLLLGEGAAALLQIGGIAAVLFGAHSVLLVIPARKRLDRSTWGEILGAAGLTLTGPAAWAAARGGLDSGAWTVWAFSVLYFSGAIFFVKMWLEAVKLKKVWSEELRAEVGRETLLYHGGLAAALLFLAGSGGGVYLLAGFAPALIRAFAGWARLKPALPNLKMLGVFESVIAVWFGVFLAMALK